jgi:hypothetical protein
MTRRRKFWTRFAVAVAGIAAACVILLFAAPVSIQLHAGLLPSANDPFLDGSNQTFQSITWHLGNGLRTWGETRGVKIWRAYLTVQVKHTNPNVTSTQAAED